VRLHPSHLSRLESGGLTQPSPEKLQLIAQILGVDYNDLFALAGYVTPDGLPSLVPYLRASTR